MPITNPSPIKFISTSTPPTGSNPTASSLIDVNRDGNLDLITADRGTLSNNGTISILLGNGNGTFQAANLFTDLSGSFSFVTAADFTGDSILDLAVANTSSDTVSLLRGQGDGTFDVETTSDSLQGDPNALAVADFNRDGIFDIVTADANSGDSFSVSLLLGQRTEDGFEFQDPLPFFDNDTILESTDSFFRAAADLPLDSEPGSTSGSNSIAVGDFNRDGIPDVATANSSSQNPITVLLGVGESDDFTFELAPPVPELPVSPLFMVAQDINGDSITDLVTANGSSNTISLLFGNGDFEGTFKAPTTLAAGNNPTTLATGDLNGDGIPDIVTTNGDNSISVLLGLGGGNFASAVAFPVTGLTPKAIEIGDVNGNGKPDLVTTNLNSSNATTLINQTNFVFLDSTNAIIDGVNEGDASISANLDTGLLSIHSDPIVTSSVAGTRRVNGTKLNDTILGSNANDELVGHEGDDILMGGGGNDVLTGNAGRDRFVFDQNARFKMATMGVDLITDFTVGQDKIVLDRTTFPKLKGERPKFGSYKTLNALLKAKGDESKHQIVYVGSKGHLYYNANGEKPGWGSGGLFADLTNKLQLTRADIEIQI
jgi:Ca2+-binding RTX toxin-like protein